MPTTLRSAASRLPISSVISSEVEKSLGPEHWTLATGTWSLGRSAPAAPLSTDYRMLSTLRRPSAVSRRL
jgi:hypothetical protein